MYQIDVKNYLKLDKIEYLKNRNNFDRKLIKCQSWKEILIVLYV